MGKESVMKDIKVGVIGCGYWGPNLIRNFNDNYRTDIRFVCDLNREKLERIKIRYPFIETATDYKKLLKDKNIDAVAIATPVFTHYKLVKEALEAGKHVLVEKPLTTSVSEAEKLIEAAARKNLVLLVDHTYIYTDSVRKIKNLLDNNHLGDMYYFDSVRVNLGLFQHDINVIWDLAPHDLSIMNYLLNVEPQSVIATGARHAGSKFEDIAYVTIRFAGDLIAHFHVNWMSPIKIRRIIIGGSKKMLVFDDLDPAEKIKIYDKGVMLSKGSEKSLYQTMIQYRIGDMHAPAINNTEALKTEIDHFADCILLKTAPITDGESGLKVIRILEAADRSIKKGGVKVKI